MLCYSHVELDLLQVCVVLQSKLSQLMVLEEAAGSSHSEPVMILPACTCLHLKELQQILLQTSFLFDNKNRIVLRESCKI